jgi:hypothetical protein
MASFKDYMKDGNEALDDEINQASSAQEERVTIGIPESVISRFDGKSQEEVLRSYAQLERAYSQQGNKMGELRQSFDQYVTLQSKSEPAPEYKPVTADDMYEDPENAVARVVERTTGDKLKELEVELGKVKTERRVSEFERKFPNAREIAESDDFAAWIHGSPYRARLAQNADRYDFEAAEELFSLYNDSTQSKVDTKATTKRNKQLRDASLESSSPESAKLDDVFSRSDIIDAKLAARRGVGDAQTWLKKHAEAIAIAYEEGRVVD